VSDYLKLIYRRALMQGDPALVLYEHSPRKGSGEALIAVPDKHDGPAIWTSRPRPRPLGLLRGNLEIREGGHMADYAKQDVLVDTDWLDEHLGDQAVRVIEVDEDTNAYEKGHIQGSVAWNWTTDLHTKVGRDYLDQAGY